MSKRLGPTLSLIERTDGVLRVLAGEDVATIAASLRVSPSKVRNWINEEWRCCRGPWSSGANAWSSGGPELSPAELLAGCELVEIPESERESEWRTHERRIGRPCSDPALVAAMYVERRELFVSLITSRPPDLASGVLDQHMRVWQMLSDRDRDQLGPAWDAYQLAAECLYDARRKIAAIVESARAGDMNANAEAA